MITKVPIHVQASNELDMFERKRKPNPVQLASRIRKPNPFAGAFNKPQIEGEKNYDVSEYKNLLGSKVVQGDKKTQFRIRPQTPKLDMILLQKAKRNKLK
jgi:hypothetical protein